MSGLDLHVIATGEHLVGNGIVSVDTSLKHLIEGARREIILVSYSVNSNADHLVEALAERLASGVKVTWIVNRLGENRDSVPRALKGLAAEYAHFRLIDFTPPEGQDLHAKLAIADRHIMIIGSANLSFRGLVNNHEIAVELRGSQVARVASAADRLENSPFSRRVTT